jgi:hypothetical protein
MNKISVFLHIGDESLQLYAKSIADATELVETILSHADECDNPTYSVQIVSEVDKP